MASVTAPPPSGSAAITEQARDTLAAAASAIPVVRIPSEWKGRSPTGFDQLPFSGNSRFGVRVAQAHAGVGLSMAFFEIA